MWTKITRKKYARDGLRYASDTTDEEWAVIEPLLPLPAKGRGRPRTTLLRSVVNALEGISIVAQELGADEGVGISTNQTAASNTASPSGPHTAASPSSVNDLARSLAAAPAIAG